MNQTKDKEALNRLTNLYRYLSLFDFFQIHALVGINENIKSAKIIRSTFVLCEKQRENTVFSSKRYLLRPMTSMFII